MKAVRCATGLEVEEIDPPSPGPGEALIRVELAGICNTDLEIVRGYMSFEGTLGHEFVGVVEEAPDSELVGARVVGEINLACQRCSLCAMNLGRHCPNRTVLGILGKDGCFASHVTMPTANLHQVPEGLASETAVFAEPLAAAFEILEQVDIHSGQRIAVLGDGKLGLLAAMALLPHASVLVVGKHARKLAIAAAAGADTMLLSDFADANDHTRGFDVVVEATGSAAGLGLAIDRLRPRGTLVLKSTVAEQPTVDTAQIVIHELQVVGSRCGLFPPALSALAEHRVDPTPLLAETFALDDAVAAFERAAAPGVLKVLLRPNDS
ncbi:MAG: alcohol dehydrogenase catalytic domain-containing protein [Myxococcota bacterium]